MPTYLNFFLLVLVSTSKKKITSLIKVTEKLGQLFVYTHFFLT